MLDLVIEGSTQERPDTCEELARFAKAYLEWAGGGAQHHHFFVDSGGLCTNLDRWSVCSEDHPLDLLRVLKYLLLSIYHDCAYPFGGEARFDDDIFGRTAHTNTMRLAFCKYIVDTNCNTKPVTDDFGNIVIVRAD